MSNTRLHWNYFLAIEQDLEKVSRYIEFCPDNFNTYSIELAHLLLSAASEVDVLLKCICSILTPNAKARNIDDYREIIKTAEQNENCGPSTAGQIVGLAEKHKLSNVRVFVPRYGLEFVPWDNWAKETNPDWWHSYNKVKHERNRYFDKATLQNALQAVAALLASNYVYCRLEISQANPQLRYQWRGKSVTRRMEPESTLLRFGSDFYDDPIAELGKFISAM